ncbi:MAG: ATP-dependent 6-phosphofructokinase [Anaerolinea sp.]|nr:ATP-dependent 6-phosphofructokinase [Anaerolinea sp.]MCC6976183.1 ATP-dependent 6-phosphofructokinase [Anaerolineae bacterium]CAG1005671.1 ATP-dependent phosphofructokinase / diphosphate-dependent phosphofructokinase [Anaerolineae bacterium]
MRIGVLTGGGDVPGLNPCIKAMVNRAIDNGYEVLGIRRGWMGLLRYNPDADDNKRWIIPLDREAVRRVDRSGGTFLHTSRTRPSNVKGDDMPDFLKEPGKTYDKPQDCTPHILKVIEKLGIDCLVPIGGDDTLSYGEDLSHHGVRVIGIPKTMDNDVYGTDYCIGFSTAVTRSVEFIHALRTSAGSHERIAVIELFGRNSGETSLIAAYLAGVDRALISEVPFDYERLAKLIVDDKSRNPSNYAMLTVSEGAHPKEGTVIETGEADAYGHRKLGGVGQEVGEVLKKLTKQNIIYQQVAYLMRSGAPDSLDLMVAANYAHVAMSLIERGESGRLVCLQRGVYSDVPISTLSQGKKRVNVAELYDSENYRPRVQHVLGMPMFLT